MNRYLTGMVDQRTLEKYEREAKSKNRESWLVTCIFVINTYLHSVTLESNMSVI
jgi:translation elongation factor EF-1alpha